VNVQATPPIVRMRAVHKHFMLGSNRVVGLAGVDLDVQAGELLVLMGPSGSGKSTLLNLIGGLDRPTRGRIVARGQEISSMDEISLAEYRRRSVGFVFQSFNLVPTMTARANVEFPMTFAGVARGARRARAESLLRGVGLGERMTHRPLELSGGEQQRVAVARALANRPKILLGDEPTGNLDTKTGGEVMEIFDRLNRRGLTVILVTHDPRVAAYAHRVIRIQDGRILAEEVPHVASPAEAWGVATG
jgi:ABC-type lipoprotein export system ATPase subunit